MVIAEYKTQVNVESKGQLDRNRFRDEIQRYWTEKMQMGRQRAEMER